MNNEPFGFMHFNFPEDLSKSILDSNILNVERLWKKSLIADADEPNQSRTSSEIRLDFFSKEIKNKTFDLIKGCKDEYNKKYIHANLNKAEKVSLLRYKAGQYFEEHSDSGWNVYRTTSVIIYLNPKEYEGGETYFPAFDLSFKPEKPEIVFFPSNYIYAHKAMPIIFGEKFVLVTWFSDLPDDKVSGDFQEF